MSYNKAYHNYFEGYAEREVQDEKTGKRKKERIYADDYYKHNISDDAWKKLKQRYAMRVGLAIIVLVAEGIYDFNGAANQWYIGGPIGLAALALLWLCYILGCYLLADREMTVSQYRNSELLKVICMGACIAFGLCCCGFIALSLFHRESIIPSALCILANFSICILLRRIYNEENAMLYIRVKNDAHIPADAYVISRGKKQKLGG